MIFQLTQEWLFLPTIQLHLPGRKTAEFWILQDQKWSAELPRRGRKTRFRKIEIFLQEPSSSPQGS